ncbi:hypothetical protein CU097_013272 [Rhizopus azygosporus]|uniref:Erv26 super protein n=1 Tax=Rhizopus azygosporus TaxID=86630 RepID=A0A367K6L0_RHIAZ|nr:hypothetical protein CU097_013272 [Rhizopus azygosporus]
MGLLHPIAYIATGLAFCFFIFSLVLVFADHFLWFRYFTAHYKPFMDIAAFFGLCVWLVPFAYFISLSANDNALPISGLLKTLLGCFGIKQQEVPNESLDYTNNTNYHRSATNTITTTREGIQNRKAI